MTPKKYKALTDKIVEANMYKIFIVPSLEEVLNTIGSGKFVVDCGGEFWRVTDLDEIAGLERLKVRWIFGNCLHLQSEETQDWLYSVIVKK